MAKYDISEQALDDLSRIWEKSSQYWTPSGILQKMTDSAGGFRFIFHKNTVALFPPRSPFLRGGIILGLKHYF